VSPTARRVLARFLAADLDPPLGEPGGPCQVVRRIRDQVSSPVLQEHLIDEVEHGADLSNPEAAKVYHLDHEPGTGFIKQILIGPHAQYRMDLRAVTVDDVRGALATFNKQLAQHQSRNPKLHTLLTTKLTYGDEIRFEGPSRLTVVFAMKGAAAMIVTTFWDGVPDPRAPSQGCPVAY